MHITQRHAILAMIIMALHTLSCAKDTQHTHRSPRQWGWGVARKQGHRPYQEDRYDHYVTDSCAVFGVYDGHGGHEMAEALSSGVSTIEPIAQTLAQSEDTGRFRTICTNWEDRMKEHEPLACTNGSTATCVYAHANQDTLHLINVGDSRTLVIFDDGRTCATRDQTAQNEYQRILDAGGQITLARGSIAITQNEHGLYDVVRYDEPDQSTTVSADQLSAYIHARDVVRCPHLIPSRTFGDCRITQSGLRKDPGVTAEPECTYCLSLSRIKAIIMATDGVWDTITNDAMYRMVTEAQKNGKTAPYIVHRQASDHDNTTALVIFPQHT